MPDYRLRRLNGEFCAVWYEGKLRKRWKLGTHNAAEARAALRDFIKERERLAEPTDEPTVAELWSLYVNHKEKQGKASVARMRDAWKSLGSHFGEMYSDDIDDDVVRDYTAARRKKSISDGTLHTELGYLRAALRYAEKRSRISKAPWIELPSKPRPRKRHLDAEEARRLIAAARMPHVKLFILLSLYTAGRPSSILDLTWDRVDFAARKIELDNPEVDRTAKGRALVPMHKDLIVPLLEARKAALTDHVIEWAGERVRSIKKGVAAACRRAGLEDVTPYVLRHTAGVWMAEGGSPMEEIAQYMGHTNPAVTFRVYARFSPKHLQAAAGTISDRLK
jgi:integrase